MTGVVGRTASFLVQIACIWLILLLAMQLSDWMYIVPWKKKTPLGSDDFRLLLSVFVVVHVLVLGVSAWRHGTAPLASARRAMAELYSATAATSVSSCVMFLLTTVPFTTNYFAWIFVITAALYGFGVLIALVWDRGRSDGTAGVGPLLRLVFSLRTPLVGAVVLSPAVLAGLYKTDQGFSNLVNEARAMFNVESSSEWVLQEAFPGQSFEQPIYLEFVSESPREMLVLSRMGRLYHYRTEPEWSEELILDLWPDVASVDVEQGAFSFARHPEFGQPGSVNRGFIYLWHSSRAEGKPRNRLTRFDISGTTLEERMASRMILIDVERSNTGEHHGGTVLFDRDGFLLVSIGDFGRRYGNTQQLDIKLASGIIRIDVDRRGGDVSAPIRFRVPGVRTQGYYIPKDNPWYGRPRSLEEFWAIGFRNPFRVSLDPISGQLWVGEVGWDAWEEHNLVRAGDNGQWPYMEAHVPTDVPRPDAPLGREIEPFLVYPQSALERATVGGLLYRGAHHPTLHGLYVFGDNNASTIYSVDPERPETMKTLTRAHQFGQLGLTSFALDAQGRIYVTILGAKQERSGQILRLAEADGLGGSVQQAAAPLRTPQESVDIKYDSVCSRCHGMDGTGRSGMEGGTMEVTPADFTSPSWQSSVSDEHIAQVIQLGGPAVGRSRDMPAWRGLFDDEEMVLLIRKIRGFSHASAAAPREPSPEPPLL